MLEEKLPDTSYIQPEAGKDVTIALAATAAEIEAAQKLRYKVFYDECGAIPTPQMQAEKRDFDPYDDIADHLIVIDNQIADPVQRIVGTYRLIRQDRLPEGGSFYTSHEFDVTPFLTSGMTLLELGRSCILSPYRTRPILQRMWQAIAAYLTDHKIDLMFGCASFNGVDPQAISEGLSYLYHFHKAPGNLCPTGLPDRSIAMNLMAKEDINEREAFGNLPPLIKGYLRLGATIGDGAYIDYQFNTIDVCIVLPTQLVTAKYMKRFDRLNQQTAQG